jgi:hypothetical protein
MGRLQNTNDLIGTTGKERQLTQAMQTMNATFKDIDKLAAGGLAGGQREQMRALAEEIYKKQVAEINKADSAKVKTLSKRQAGAEAGFEGVGLTRSRLSGKGGPLDIVRDKAPTQQGQKLTNNLLGKLVDKANGKSVAVAG